MAENHGAMSRLGQLAMLVTRLPRTAGELFTASQSTWAMLLGYPLLALIAVGLIRLWRRGLRTPAVTIVLSVVAMAIGAVTIADKARYYMPLLPLIALGLIEGVVATVEWVRQITRRPAGGRTRTWAMIITVALIAAVNAPDVARSAFYESYQAHRGRYLDVIAGGAYADLYATAEHLRDNVQPGEKVLVRPDRVRMLHLLSGKLIDPMYDFGVNNPWNAAQAEATYRDLLSRPAVEWVVFDPGGLDGRYTRRLRDLLDATAGLKLYIQLRTTRIYHREGPRVPATASAPATEPAPSPRSGAQ